MMLKIMIRRLRNTKGAVAVEFALVALVFFIMIFGIIDFGWYFFVKHSIKLASLKGTRVGMVTDNSTRVAQKIRDSASIAVDPNELDISITGDPIPPIDPDIREVTTRYTHDFFTPIIGAFFPGGNATIEVKDTYKLEPPWLY